MYLELFIYTVAENLIYWLLLYNWQGVFYFSCFFSRKFYNLTIQSWTNTISTLDPNKRKKYWSMSYETSSEHQLVYWFSLKIQEA